MSESDNALTSITTAMAFSSRDWAANHRDAWLYAIAVGWDDEALQAVAAQHRWDELTVDRVRRLRAQFQQLSAQPLPVTN